MMKRTGITVHTLAGLQGLQTIVPQLGDQVMVSDLRHAVFKYVPTAGTDDGQNILVQSIGGTDYSWVRQGLNLIGAFGVPYTALPDNTESFFEVDAAGILRDGAYMISVITGEPTNAAGDVANYQRVRPSADDKLAIQIQNNTGADLVPGTFQMNVFQVGG
jgi:hypothetical protein